MRTVLTDFFVSENSQGIGELMARKIARGFHAAKTSSRTKCKRMILGMGPGTPSPK
jgi:hypothetical protein